MLRVHRTIGHLRRVMVRPIHVTPLRDSLPARASQSPPGWLGSTQTPNVALRHHHVIERDAPGDPYRFVGGIHLQPDPVQLELRIAPPTEAREGAASRILGENPCRPRALRKPLAEAADFDAIQPDRMLAVRGGDGIIEL